MFEFQHVNASRMEIVVLIGHVFFYALSQKWAIGFRTTNQLCTKFWKNESDSCAMLSEDYGEEKVICFGVAYTVQSELACRTHKRRQCSYLSL